jgi:hypothetical protein
MNGRLRFPAEVTEISSPVLYISSKGKMITVSASCPVRVRTLVSRIRPPPFGTTSPNVFMTPRNDAANMVRELDRDADESRAAADQCPQPYRRPALDANLPEETGLGEKRQPIGVVGVGLVWRRIECRLRMPCVDACRRETGPVSNTTTTASGACFLIISATSWGSDKHLPRQIHLRFCRPVIDVSFNDTSNPAYWSMAVLLGARC